MLKAKESVENMTGYYVPMYEKNWDIKIDSNENNYGPSPKVLQVLNTCNIKNVSFYPFYGELSQKIADYYNLNINNVKVTNGADEAIQGIIQTYLDKNEALLTLDISFEMPVIYTQIQGGNVIKVPFKDSWEFPVDDFLNKLHNNKEIKIVYLASPNNPTGTLISEEHLKKILQASTGKAVIIDETYANYAGITNKEYIKTYDNVFIVRSFSKDFALAGLRLGCILSNENNINMLKKVISPFSVNALAAMAGMTALDDVDYLNYVVAEINQSKKELNEFFTALGANVYNSSANFLLVDFKQKSQFVFNKLKKENIIVKLFKKGTRLENHLRITIPNKNGVQKIKNALKIKPALVFDMDGVLIDARNSYRTTIEKTFEKFTGKQVSPQEIQAIKNQGGMNNDWDLTQYLIKKEGIDVSYSQITEVFQKIYWDGGNGLINNENTLFDRKLFEKLSEKYNLSIFTGRLKAEAMYALKRFNAEDLFFPIITTDDIPPGMEKPNPCGLNLTRDLTLSDKYYYFGDTQDDIKAAASAGYIPVGVLPPQDKSEELIQIMKDKGARFVLQSINDIETILENTYEAKC